MFVRVAVLGPVPVSVPVSVMVSPASVESAASLTTPELSCSPFAVSLLVAQFTAAAASAIATTLRVLDSMSLPRWPNGSAQSPRRQL